MLRKLPLLFNKHGIIFFLFLLSSSSTSKLEHHTFKLWTKIFHICWIPTKMSALNKYFVSNLCKYFVNSLCEHFFQMKLNCKITVSKITLFWIYKTQQVCLKFPCWYCRISSILNYLVLTLFSVWGDSTECIFKSHYIPIKRLVNHTAEGRKNSVGQKLLNFNYSVKENVICSYKITRTRHESLS